MLFLGKGYSSLELKKQDYVEYILMLLEKTNENDGREIEKALIAFSILCKDRHMYQLCETGFICGWSQDYWSKPDQIERVYDELMSIITVVSYEDVSDFKAKLFERQKNYREREIIEGGTRITKLLSKVCTFGILATITFFIFNRNHEYLTFASLAGFSCYGWMCQRQIHKNNALLVEYSKVK